ncbi:MAG: flagellar hook basal-body protein [Pseudomonadota bacterium]
MENTSYITLSSQVATQRRMNVLSNNLANMNTPGFKADKPMFLEYIEKIDGQEFRDRNQRRMSMVNDYGTFTDFRQGTFEPTGGPLDMALNGSGFFAVDLGGGARGYTRNGSFQLDSDRRLVNTQGLPVLDTNDNEINIPNGDAQIRVAEDGTLSTETGVIAQIKVVRFNREQFMEPRGDGIRTTDEAEQDNEGTTIQQGMLEGSNVNPITAMTDLITISRAYSRAQNMGNQEHERIGRAIRKLSGTN